LASRRAAREEECIYSDNVEVNASQEGIYLQGGEYEN